MKSNFSFTDFMGFSENLVNTLELVAEKVDDISNKIAQIEETVGVEGADQAAIDAVSGGEELGGDVPQTDDLSGGDDLSGVDLNGEAGGTDNEGQVDNGMPPAPDVEAGDGELAPSEFSFVVVGRRERPWGNAVVSVKEFSTNKDKYTKLIPTTFSTQAQAQRALTSYNVNGENFSIRYNNVKNILNM